ncbi:MAG TPA: hypothetical protein VG324_28300, partial [Blastocatellia bacterium]|nr:hypothetical protein [Blastocatellia bacterium]
PSLKDRFLTEFAPAEPEILSDELLAPTHALLLRNTLSFGDKYLCPLGACHFRCSEWLSLAA